MIPGVAPRGEAAHGVRRPFGGKLTRGRKSGGSHYPAPAARFAAGGVFFPAGDIFFARDMLRTGGTCFAGELVA